MSLTPDHKPPAEINGYRAPVADDQGVPRARTRWPGRSRAATPGGFQGDPRELRHHPDPAETVLGQLTAALVNMQRSPVLGSGVYKADANGQAAEQYHTRFAALAVMSKSANSLIVANSPLQIGAPGLGQGMALIPPGAFRVVNLAGHAWSLYGANPGDLIEIEALTKPCDPAGALGSVALAAGGAVSLASDYPAGAVPVSASSGNQANAIATATLAGVAGHTTYLTGFEATASGATAALAVNLTVTGTLGGTLNYAFVFPIGVAVGAFPLTVEFEHPIPGSATGVSIAVSLPASGAGGTNAAVNAHGYTL